MSKSNNSVQSKPAIQVTSTSNGPRGPLQLETQLENFTTFYWFAEF
jgi:hypothetical protein